MSDPYARHLFERNPYARCRNVVGEVVVVLDAQLANRRLELIKPISRALCRHEIHELILTTDMAAGPGRTVESVSYIGFFAVTQGSVALVGSRVTIGGHTVGILAGYDETHAPNHLNVVLKGEDGRTGLERGIQLGDTVIICPPEQ